MFKTISEAIAWVTTRTKSKYVLSDFQNFLDEHGNPEKKIKTIHIAGTNGKGSTTNYLRSIFQCAGYKVGSFTSPHLVVHNDRIRINNENIPDEDLLKYINDYYDDFQQAGLSMFEIDMFIACKYFQEQKVDYAMMEVGLGGQLDATNVLRPLVSVITTIDYDHMQYLGNTIEEIASAKAGIIKENIPVVTGVKREEALNVIRKKAISSSSKLYLTSEVTNISQKDEIAFDYKDYHDIHLNTLALYQCHNASIVLEVVEVLKELGITFSDKEIRDGLYQGTWAGRFEKISNEPLIFLDGAHNQEGIRALSKTVNSLNKDCVIVFAALKDKETDKMLEMLLDISKNLIVTEFDFYRTKDAKSLASNYPVTVIENYQQAISKALEMKKEMVIITGSLYFISVVREYLKGEL